MRRPSIALVLLALAALPALAADEDTRRGPLTKWQWQADVELPKAGKTARWYDFVLTPEVFDKALPDLGDLRMLDADGKEVRYALKVRTARDEQQPVRIHTEFNRVTNADRSVSVTLDLGEAPSQHNEIRVDTTGDNVRRRLLVEGSDTGKTWNALVQDAWLLHFDAGTQRMNVRRFHYAPSRFRYVRVQVFPDPALEKDAPTISSATVYHSVKVPGEDYVWQAELGPREPVRADGGPGSAWTIDLGGNNTPVAELLLDVADAGFSRPFRVDAALPQGGFQQVHYGTLSRRAGDGRKPLKVTFPEITTGRLRLIITDSANEPLQLKGVRCSAPARAVVFATSATPPVRLYFGNPDALPPHYDFEAHLPPVLEPPPVHGKVAALSPNPDYQPPPKPWTERWPWLVYVVLTVASLVLLGILGLLGKEAIFRHDVAAAEGRPPESDG